VVYVATAMAGPGHVRHFGRGELVIAPSPTSEQLARTFAAAGIPMQVSDNVAGALWAKLVLNCVYNPLSAITRLPYGEIVNAQGLDVPRAMDDIVRECLAVAHASGIALPEGTAEAVLPLAASMPGQVSSTAQDLARGRHTEIDHLNGFIVRRGEALGIATPANRLLHILVRLLEARLT
jgi:2-dehydropantoate 2-reductase